MRPISLSNDACFPVATSIVEALQRYINYGIMPGDFLTAVLENNLSESVGRADLANGRNLRNIVCYIREHVPSNAWGSPKIVMEYGFSRIQLREKENGK